MVLHSWDPAHISMNRRACPWSSFRYEYGTGEIPLFNDKVPHVDIRQYAIGFLGTVGSWFLMQRVGRRTLYVHGLALLTLLLLLIGLVSISNSDGAAWAIGSMLLIYTFTYDITVGPVCYSLVSEIPSTRLKTKSIVLARNVYNGTSILNRSTQTSQSIVPCIDPS